MVRISICKQVYKMHVAVLLTFIASVSALDRQKRSTVVAQCDSPYIRVGNACYHIEPSLEDGKRYDEAKAICEGEGASLPSFDTSDEFYSLKRRISSEPAYNVQIRYWMNGYKDSNGVWRWGTTGEMIPSSLLDQLWGWNEPNNHHGNENNMNILQRLDYMLNDANERRKSGYICKKATRGCPDTRNYQCDAPIAEGPSCHVLRAAGYTTDGLYRIPIDGNVRDVYCDMTTDGGGWTVIQRREDGSVDFNRNWASYENGFGDVCGEFWFGLSLIHAVTNSGPGFQMRVDLSDWDCDTAFTTYEAFSVAASPYRIGLGADLFFGTAGESMAYQHGRPFSTYDNDTTYPYYPVSVHMKSGWWFAKDGSWGYSNLNAVYRVGGDIAYGDRSGIWWYSWRPWQSLRTTEMKLRPAEFLNCQ